jgi:hypothetical protein
MLDVLRPENEKSERKEEQRKAKRHPALNPGPDVQTC